MAHSYTRSSTDANQPEIVDALRAYEEEGLENPVVIIVTCTKKFCDVIAVFNSKIFLIEIKDGSKPPSQRRLTPGEEEAKAKLAKVGVTIHLVNNEEEAINVIKTK